MSKRHKEEKKKLKEEKKKLKKEKKANKPLSVFGLIISIIKGIIQSIPKMWKSILIRSIISFFVVTSFSVYSIAVKNEGIGLIKLNSGKFWSDVINTGGNEVAFNVMSFVLTYALTLIYSRIRNGGIKKFFKEVFGTIPWTKNCILGSKNVIGPLMFFSMGLVMILGIFAKNNILFITLAITIFFEYASKEKSLVFAVSLAFWNDFHRLFKRKKGIQPLNKEYVGIMTFSMLLGMIILALIPINRARLISIILMIVFIALTVLLTYNKISKKAVKSAMFFIVFALMAQRLTGIVFADNGGWSEGGKSVSTYVGSAGSVGVFITSAVSGLFSVAGGLLGVTIGALGGNLDVKGNWNYGSGMGAALGEDVAYVGIETVVGIKDLTVDLFTGCHLIKQTKENIDKEMTDFFDKGFQIKEEVSEWIDENVTTEVVLDTAEGMIKDINGLVSGEYAAEWIKDELQEFYNDPEAYVNNAIEIIEKGGTLTGKASVAVENFLNKIKNDPRAAYEIIKALSPADSIKNIIDPNKGLGERMLNVPFATMDVAEILVGFGLVNIATEVAEQGVKLGVKTVIKEGVEEIAERGTKEVVEEVVERGTKEVVEEVAERGTKEAVEEVAERGTKEAVEEVGERGTKEAVEEVGERGTKEVVEEVGERGTKEVTEEVGERGTKEVTEEVGERGTKEVTEEVGERGTKEAVRK
ncbi:hypothetical protein QUF55_00770 [Clostridiaceae bacterium HSG29]|nr:hypothetical protein [Clostridiaceae bacterium HSG29]